MNEHEGESPMAVAQGQREGSEISALSSLEKDLAGLIVVPHDQQKRSLILALMEQMGRLESKRVRVTTVPACNSDASME